MIGLSILSGAHLALFPRIMEALREQGLDDVLVVAGGTIPEEDIAEVKRLGIAAVFGPGTSLHTAIDFIRQHAPRGSATPAGRPAKTSNASGSRVPGRRASAARSA